MAKFNFFRLPQIDGLYKSSSTVASTTEYDLSKSIMVYNYWFGGLSLIIYLQLIVITSVRCIFIVSMLKLVSFTLSVL